MKVFITGATGFIGRHLVNRLIRDGCDVSVNLRYGKSSPFGDDVNTYCFNENDAVTNINYFKRECFDGVVHLAAACINTHLPQDVSILVDSNVRLGSCLLECASNAGIKWFINTGTFWQHYQCKGYSPVNLYAATKQAFETIAQYYVETDRIKFVSLRLFDTFGPDDSRPKIFNLWSKIAETGEELDMSPGEQLIDISYIDDVISAYTLLIEQISIRDSNISNGAVYAVKADQRFTLRQLADLFQESTGKKLNINWGGREYRDREVMIPWSDVDTVPGWSVKVSLRDGIKKMCSFYSQNKSIEH